MHIQFTVARPTHQGAQQSITLKHICLLYRQTLRIPGCLYHTLRIESTRGVLREVVREAPEKPWLLRR